MNRIDRVLMAIADWLWRTFRPSAKHNPFFFVIENAEGDPYLVRYKLFRCRWFRIFLHHILRSDEDVELHDHPWNFVSLILWEGYYEFNSIPGVPGAPDWPRRMRAGGVVRHRAADAHRLILERPAWTLVLATGKKRHWGFWREGKWEPHEVFFDRKYGAGNWVSL